MRGRNVNVDKPALRHHQRTSRKGEHETQLTARADALLSLPPSAPHSIRQHTKSDQSASAPPPAATRRAFFLLLVVPLAAGAASCSAPISDSMYALTPTSAFAEKVPLRVVGVDHDGRLRDYQFSRPEHSRALAVRSQHAEQAGARCTDACWCTLALHGGSREPPVTQKQKERTSRGCHGAGGRHSGAPAFHGS